MADVIIVPGRGIHADGSLYDDPQSRIRKAAELINKRVADKIIMSGGFSFHLDNTTNVNEASSMKDYAISLGIKPECIFTEDKSTHTLANAYFCKKLFCEPNEWKTIIVVASSDHMPRVKYVFNKVFGPNYKIKYQTSRRVIGFGKYTKEMVHEIGSMWLTIKWLSNVQNGDDESIRKIVLQNRPNDTMRN